MRTRTLSVAVAVMLGGMGVEAQPQDRVFAIRIGDEGTARLVKDALEGAARRLGRPRCQRLFDEFSDAGGQPLRVRLEQLGANGADYLSLLAFHDGSRHSRCRTQNTLAMTEVGGRIVWICPEAFRQAALRQPTLVEAVLIHELLHTLGLGENPPPGDRITGRVRSACWQ